MSVDMPRLTLSQKTVEEEREAIWLRGIESGDTTVQDLSHVTGLSVRRIQERLKRARENRGEIEPDDGDQFEVGRLPLDEDLLPYLCLTDDPSGEPGHYYDLRTDRTSLDTGRVRINDHNGTRLKVRSLTGGLKTEEAIKQHKPDPSGLKGGVG